MGTPGVLVAALDCSGALTTWRATTRSPDFLFDSSPEERDTAPTKLDSPGAESDLNPEPGAGTVSAMPEFAVEAATPSGLHHERREVQWLRGTSRHLAPHDPDDRNQAPVPTVHPCTACSTVRAPPTNGQGVGQPHLHGA